MRHEWRSGARSPDSRSSCESTDAPRLPADAADAFVDRLTIDWSALLHRARDASERAVLENLRRLDAIRAPSPRSGIVATSAARTGALRLVTLLAATQTTACLAAIGLSAVGGVDLVARLPQISITLAFASGSLFLAVRAPFDPNGIRLSAAFAASASAFARSAIVILPPSSIWLPIALHGLFPEAFVPAILWELAIGFPRVPRFTAFDVHSRRAARVAWSLGLLLFGVNVFAFYGGSATWIARLQRDDPGNLFWHLFVIAAAPALASILVRSRIAPRGERRKVARFAAAIAVGAAPLLLSGVARMLVPAVDDWMADPQSPGRQWLDHLILGALMSVPIACSVAVVADGAFELPPREIWHRRARSLGSIAIRTATIAALVVTIYGLRHESLGDVASNSTLWLAVVVTLVAILIPGVPRGFWTMNDEASPPPVVRHRRLTASLERVRVARGPREVAAALERELRRDIGATAAYVLAVDSTGRGLVDPRGRVGSLPHDSALRAILTSTAEPIDLGDQQLRALLPRSDLDWARRNDVRVLAPIRRAEGSLTAVAALGRKRGDEPFDRRDRWYVSMLTTAAATVWTAGDAMPGTTSRQREDNVAYECSQCGTVAGRLPIACECGTPPHLAALPAHVGRRFVVDRRIGAGAMGVVYLARDTELDRPVALKTLPDVRAAAIEGLRSEARAMARVNHASIATIYGLEWWRGTPILVVEYFERGTLADLLRSRRLPDAIVIDIGRRLAAALDHMHRLGVLHRDLKPSNVGITLDGVPKLLDLGLAALMESDVDEGGRSRCAGTPAYLPPEAFAGTAPSFAFDLWALATMLAEAATGLEPGHRGRAWRRALAARLDVRRHPDPLSAFLSCALAKDPRARFAAAQEMLQALEAIRT